MIGPARSAWTNIHAIPILISLAIVGLVTLFLAAVGPLVELDHAAFGYLIPVIVAASRWGMLPAIISAAAGMAASAFFFYPPIFDIRVYNQAHVADLLLFAVVAIIAGQHANSVRLHELDARQRGDEIKALYFFSRRLAVASRPAEIYAAIQEHLSAITGYRVLLFEAGTERLRLEALPQWQRAPATVQRAIVQIIERDIDNGGQTVLDDLNRATWLVRPLSQRTSLFGVLAIEIGRAAEQDMEATRQRIDSAIRDAAATIERIDVANVIGEAKVRAEADTLRDALIGSVSHELRSPLASIVGSASILIEAPAIVADARLSALLAVVRDEAERLNHDIQNLLDASRISSAGVRPHLEWADPVDIVNAAVDSRRRLAPQHIELDLPDDLPLVHVDPVLIQQALAQVIGNALTYSAPESTVRIAASGQNGAVEIVVADQGAGLSSEERSRMLEKFYRGPRHHATVAGSGLGLWIAHAFVTACGGTLEPASPGIGRGTTITLKLAATQQSPSAPPGAADD